VFYNSCDIGLVMYNAYNEGNNNFQNLDAREWVMSGGKCRLRGISLVRNKNGSQNVTKNLVFLEECAYFTELPPVIPQYAEQIEKVRTILKQNL
jgi:hypothetical protein